MIYCTVCREFKNKKTILAFINKSKYICSICYNNLSSVDVLLRNKENIIISKRIKYEKFFNNNNFIYYTNDENDKTIVNTKNILDLTKIC